MVERMLFTILLLIQILLSTTEAQTGLCQCGVFVASMYPGVSNLEPLQYVDEEGSAESCNQLQCQTYCVQQSTNFNFDLAQNYPGTNTPTGQVYCERFAELFPSRSIREPQIVRARTPDEACSFVLWGTTNVFTSDVVLCCDAGYWC